MLLTYAFLFILYNEWRKYDPPNLSDILPPLRHVSQISIHVNLLPPQNYKCQVDSRHPLFIRHPNTYRAESNAILFLVQKRIFLIEMFHRLNILGPYSFLTYNGILSIN